MEVKANKSREIIVRFMKSHSEFKQLKALMISMLNVTKQVMEFFMFGS